MATWTIFFFGKLTFELFENQLINSLLTDLMKFCLLYRQILIMILLLRVNNMLITSQYMIAKWTKFDIKGLITNFK